MSKLSKEQAHISIYRHLRFLFWQALQTAWTLFKLVDAIFAVCCVSSFFSLMKTDHCTIKSLAYYNKLPLTHLVTCEVVPGTAYALAFPFPSLPFLSATKQFLQNGETELTANVPACRWLQSTLEPSLSLCHPFRSPSYCVPCLLFLYFFPTQAPLAFVCLPPPSPFCLLHTHSYLFPPSVSLFAFCPCSCCCCSWGRLPCIPLAYFLSLPLLLPCPLAHVLVCKTPKRIM